MTTLGILREDRDARAVQDSGISGTRILLWSGIFLPLVYLAADVLGGKQYSGYSFTSQAVSELMAVGAPSEKLVDRLLIGYGVLLLLFGVGVVREAASRNGTLRIAGALLIASAVIGFTGPTLFEMHPRGTAPLGADAPHIIVTGVLLLINLLAMAFATSALGGRFRRYSVATMATIILLGILSVPYGARLGAGEPTPGFGIVERILIYASQLWLAALGMTLLRRPLNGAARARE